MPGTTTLAQLRAAPAQLISWLKTYTSPKGGTTQVLHSFREANGGLYTTSPGVTPGEAVSKTYPACPPYVSASGSSALYIRDIDLGIDWGGAKALALLVDRLAHCSGLVHNTTAEQTVNLTAITRYTSGAWVWPFLAVYTEALNGAQDVTVWYTDQDGNALQQTTVGYLASSITAPRDLLPIPLLSGDYGCRTIAKCQLASAAGTAGDFGFVLARPLAVLLPTSTVGISQIVGLAGGLRKIEAGACLDLLCAENLGALPNLSLNLTVVEL